MKSINDFETFDPSWYVLFWKVIEQNARGEEIKKHAAAIKEFTVQLQGLLSIASYAISLEQLENALDATKMLQCLSMRYCRSSLSSTF